LTVGGEERGSKFPEQVVGTGGPFLRSQQEKKRNVERWGGTTARSRTEKPKKRVGKTRKKDSQSEKQERLEEGPEKFRQNPKTEGNGLP